MYQLRRRNETMKRLVNMKQKQCYIFLDVVRIAGIWMFLL